MRADGKLDGVLIDGVADVWQIWEAIHDGSIYECPSLLSAFTLITFANLKKYKFTYHFGFPAIQSDPPWKQTGEIKRLGSRETVQLVDAVQTFKYRSDARQRGFFLAKKVRSKVPEEDPDPEGPPTTPVDDLGYRWAIGSLALYEKDFFEGVEKEDQFVCFADPSTYEENPSWILRNLLVLIRYRWKIDNVQVLCYRDTHIRRDEARSLILQLESPPISELGISSEDSGTRVPKLPKVTGWERNEANKLTSRTVDLSEYMDERKLADQAVDLNLKLIKWRIAPTIDLDVIKNTKCLLLGAGTLGSYVSRILMGWGVRKISLIDNATVSFSNPVRQPLFDFKDCLQGGAKKAERAAEALEEIYPGVEAKGYVMEVPMAGHPIIDESKTKANFEQLGKLIDEHDAIFLLMDTRESRWLPTVMGKAKGKIVLNAALGFDTFVVMRHGLKPTPDGQGEEELGCYFCNDVVAPADVGPIHPPSIKKKYLKLIKPTVPQQRNPRPTMHRHPPRHRPPRLQPPRRTPHLHPPTPAARPRPRRPLHHPFKHKTPLRIPSFPPRALRPPPRRRPPHHPGYPARLYESPGHGPAVRLLLRVQR